MSAITTTSSPKTTPMLEIGVAAEGVGALYPPPRDERPSTLLADLLKRLDELNLELVCAEMIDHTPRWQAETARIRSEIEKVRSDIDAIRGAKQSREVAA